MKKALAIALCLFFLAGIAFSESALSEEIGSQTKEFFHRFSDRESGAQTVTSEDLASSEIITSIAQGVEPSQICISLGKFSADPNWHISAGGQSIYYDGGDDQKLEFFALCEKASKLKQAASFFPAEKISDSFISHCPQFREGNDKTACAVVLMKSTPIAEDDFSVSYTLFFAFAILLLIPLLFIFRAENINLKLFNLVKVVFLAMVFIVFYFIGFALSTAATVLLLFFFFVQLNLSLAPLILEIHRGEEPLTRLLLKAVMVLEFVGLVISLILMAPLL